MKAIHLKETDLVACLPEHLNEVLTDLPDGNYIVLGIVTKDHIDFDVEDLVESIEVGEYKYGGELHPNDLFLDYESKTYWLESYEDSFRSLLTANGILFVNPCGKEFPGLVPECCGFVEYDQFGFPNCCCQPVPGGESLKAYDEWQQAESQLTPKVLILKKI